MKNVSEQTAQNKINKEIKKISDNIQGFVNAGYTNYFTRNPNNKMYKLINAEYYFLGTDSNIYIIYAYGNTDYTSEADIIII